MEHGAAVLAVRCKATVKEANDDLSIAKTLDRSKLWEMQTPQVIKPDLLKEGFKLVNEKGYEVTDDVSIVEFMGERVQITEGSYVNIKVTTPEDMFIREASQRAGCDGVKRVMGIIMGYTVEARPSLKVRAPLEILIQLSTPS